MAPRNNRKGKNPVNTQSSLFKSLTRLFSGPIVTYRSQSGRKIRRQHLDKYAARFKTASGQQFKKQTYNPLDTSRSLLDYLLFHQYHHEEDLLVASKLQNILKLYNPYPP